MRRTANALTLISALLLLLTLCAWVTSYATGIHIGTWIDETDPYGTTRHYRRGVFVASGRVCFSYGTDIAWPYEGARRPASYKQRRGVYFGDFHYWEGSEDWPLGFGHASGGASAPTIGRPSKLGDVTIVSTWIGAWVALFLVLPLWRWVTRRHRIGSGSAVVVLSAYAFIAILGLMSLVMPGLAELILFAAFGAAGWTFHRVLVRPWIEKRARARAGYCRVCGYDLRATPDPAGPLLDRCPECGTFTARLAHEPRTK